MEGLVKDARPLLTVLLPVPLPLVLQYLPGLLPQVCTFFSRVGQSDSLYSSSDIQ